MPRDNKRLTKLNSVKPTPPGSKDIEPKRTDANPKIVAKIKSKCKLNALKHKKIPTASKEIAVRLINQGNNIFLLVDRENNVVLKASDRLSIMFNNFILLSFS